MHETRINNLGLNLLIRLAFCLMYLSFLGGETQRPHRNYQSKHLPAQDFFCPLHLDSKHDDTREVHLTLGKRPYSVHKAYPFVSATYEDEFLLEDGVRKH